MPRYDYRCVDCNNEFELVQSFSEAGNGVCPDCSGSGRRVFHAVPVIYKGSGFYTTDYGRAKRPEENGSNKDGGSDSSKSTSDGKTKTEASSASSTSESSSSSSDTASTASNGGSDSGASSGTDSK